MNRERKREEKWEEVETSLKRTGEKEDIEEQVKNSNVGGEDGMRTIKGRRKKCSLIVIKHFHRFVVDIRNTRECNSGSYDWNSEHRIAGFEAGMLSTTHAAPLSYGVTIEWCVLTERRDTQPSLQEQCIDAQCTTVRSAMHNW